MIVQVEINQSKRIVELDFFKGIAIILVVVGHFVLTNWADSCDKHPVYTWIYSFHMPLFFFISGYLMSLSNRGLSSKTVKKKTLALMLPFLVWSFVLAPLFAGNQVYFSLDEFLNPNTKYWFVYLLWFYSIIYYICNSIYKKSVVGGTIMLVIIACSLGVALYYFPCELFSRGLQFLPIYIYGAVAKKVNLQDKSLLDNSLILSVLFVLFVVASLCYMKMESAAFNKLMKLIASASICSIILYYVRIRAIISIDSWGKYLTQPIIYAGKNSIVVYLTHFLFLNVLPFHLKSLNLLCPFWAFIIALFFSLLICFACLLIGKVIESFLWVNRLVYGREW
jgi:fucose 4-O-acetylase-like acetyltransferase